LIGLPYPPFQWNFDICPISLFVSKPVQQVLKVNLVIPDRCLNGAVAVFRWILSINDEFSTTSHIPGVLLGSHFLVFSAVKCLKPNQGEA